MKRAGIVIFVVLGLIILFMLFNPYKERTTVGILLPTDDVDAHFDARVGFLTAMKNLPKDVHFVDVNYTSTTLVSAMKKAVEKGVEYFVSDGYSSDLEKIDGFLERTHSILIETTVTNPTMLKKAKFAFTLSPTDDVQAEAIATYLKQMGFKDVVIVKDTSNLVYVNYLAGEILKDLSGIKSKSIFLNETEKIIQPPDVFVLIMSPEHAVETVEHLKEKFPNSAFLGSDWTFHSLLLEHIQVVKGMVTIAFVDPFYLQSTLNQEISHANLVLTPAAVLAYNALKVAYVLAKEKVNYKEVKQYLNSHSFFGMGNSFTFNGIHATTPIYFYTITTAGFKLAWEFGGKS